MPKIDIDKIQIDISTGYPPPFNKAVEGRSRKRLGRAAGLDHFGVNICTLRPGAASSQRHWHEKEDELVYVLDGEVVLCEDDGETVLKAGDALFEPGGVIHYQGANNLADAQSQLIVTMFALPGSPILTVVGAEELAERQHLRH